MSKKVLLTGAPGFIGHHTVEHIFKNTDWDIVGLDRLSYAGNLNFLTDMGCWDENKHRFKFVFHDLRAEVSKLTIDLIGDVDYIIHMAAESHVDRSIEDAHPFVMSNVLGTVNMLELARILKPEKFIYVSTDEVYGPARDGHLHKEGEPHFPSNPYSASKSGAEAFAYAYWNTHGVPIIITNTMNNFGERQNAEKFVPKTIKAILNGRPVILHCKKDYQYDKEGNITNNDTAKIIDVSSRCWLHARNHADGLLFVLENGVPGEKYNISGEHANVEEIADMIAKFLGRDIRKEFQDFHTFRPGHDMHYGLDNSKLKKLGWKQPFTLEESLERTVKWMVSNRRWLIS